MGLYEASSLRKASPLVPYVAEAKSYTIYERGPVWYVGFSTPDRKQIRVSTGCSDAASAKALVESYRNRGNCGPTITISDKHIYRMIDRAKYRNRTKNIPVDLSIGLLKEVFARCNGYCEVTGHALHEDGPFRPSLDRIDPKLGYVPGNIRIVCLVTNTAMLHYGETAFAEIAIAYCRTAGILPSQSATEPT